ncbi:MAG TPA: hypothetical protein VHE34_04395 [Puia sp.]|uniref:hypothetical protein n=1 Tax=Puia sp. TaxID=2045100 RepID=UPI002BC0CB44|nr:hypothetical protein [Puia sp.]HVU94436.1 hypothetical protein [Puia sp.]
MDQNEFYIGWMAKAPALFASFIRRYLLWLIPLLLLTAAGLALLQKKASSATFEFGRITNLTGVYHSLPVPLLRINQGVDASGTTLFQTIPLVGFGKSGAGGMIGELERKMNISLEGMLLTLQGTLLYNDGKTLLQIENSDSLLRATTIPSGSDASAPQPIDLGTATVKGEIADPKCFFGVMKPGEGKPHRDCAIRCILGGIPPVLVVHNSRGRANYYLLVGPNGERMNTAVQDFVAEPVTISGKRILYDDWIILYAQDTTAIRRNSYLAEHFGNSIVSCKDGCTK